MLSGERPSGNSGGVAGPGEFLQGVAVVEYLPRKNGK